MTSVVERFARVRSARIIVDFGEYRRIYGSRNSAIEFVQLENSRAYSARSADASIC